MRTFESETTLASMTATTAEAAELPPIQAASPAEIAWAARRLVDPAQLEDSQLNRYRHPGEWRALITIALVFVAVDVALIVIGPAGREKIREQLHWLPHGLVGTIMGVIHQPGGITSTLAGFLVFTAVLDLYNHWLKRAEVLSESTEITATTFPELYPLVEELRERFDLRTVRVFAQRTASVPFSLGMGFGRPYFIVLPVAWLSMLTPDELRFVLGHEMGHIVLGHTRFDPFVGGGELGGGGALAILDQVRDLVLSSYQRAQELSGDRVGVLASRSVGPAVSVSIKTGVGMVRGARLDVEALADQAAEVHGGHMAIAGRLRQFGKSQPPLFYRLKELITWAGMPPPPPPPAAASAAGQTASAPGTGSAAQPAPSAAPTEQPGSQPDRATTTPPPVA
jgi:Zn-dependent protease with chaperone function